VLADQVPLGRIAAADELAEWILDASIGPRSLSARQRRWMTPPSSAALSMED
jgi:hypothetical protein